MSEELLDVLEAGNVDRLAALLAAGADPNKRFESCYGITPGLTPLQVAVEELDNFSEIDPGRALDAIVLLLRYGADANRCDEARGFIPLFAAVRDNQAEAVRILLAAGADPNVYDDEGRSPLRFCAQHGFLEMARILLYCGATKTINAGGGMAGMNALGLAVSWFHVDMVRLLLAHGADPRVEDVDRMTVFDHLRLTSIPKDPNAQERLRQIAQLLGSTSPW